jgi:hypothetical protein
VLELRHVKRSFFTACKISKPSQRSELGEGIANAFFAEYKNWLPNFNLTPIDLGFYYKQKCYKNCIFVMKSALL